MQIKPILVALRKHRLATALIALEIALACAVLCNACFLIAGRLANMHIVSGVDEPSLALVAVTGYDDAQGPDVNARVVAGLRGIAGVQSVDVVSTVPFGSQAGAVGITKDQAGQSFGGVIDVYVGGPGSVQALGLKLIAGAWPQAADYQPLDSWFPTEARTVVSKALAEHLWPGESPLGKEFWCDKFHFRVIGMVDHLPIAQPGSRGVASAEWAAFVPAMPGRFLNGTYLLRADPRELPRILRDAPAAVAKAAPDVVYDHAGSKTVSDFRRDYFERDRAMAGLLAGVIVALLLVTALGIVGLASFWVQQRRKQIGIRRAIGATRHDILRYFQTENFLIVSGGIVVGMAMAFALNLVLMKFYELPRLPLYYLPVGALALWVLGQLAVLAPARRAAAVPPVVATRSV
ncbi:ABC transporter permease [Dyella sedimenti]|uniref:ABC transporter permease n=1 Tax=Dyella sedimenti TaxID=2919947 RepID=UPI001FAB305D|nr:FtsX-like permease family protein [Dyella sedimenti]